VNDPYPTSVTAIGAGISDAAKETSPIQQATIRLNKVVGRLEDTVTRLRVKTSPIRNEFPTVSDGQIQADPGGSSLTNELNDQARRVEYLCDLLSTTVEEIEV
jgi:hypothetical protein